MTVSEAIAFIRLLTDESGTEYWRDSDITDALREAQVLMARRYWYRGEKEAVRPLLEVETYATPDSATLYEVLFAESVLLKVTPAGTFKARAQYISPDNYGYRLPNPTIAATHTGRYDYTIEEGEVKTNGLGFLIAYYRSPAIGGSGSELALAAYTHGAICDMAAEILHRRDYPGADRKPLGSVYDIEQLLTAT